MAITLDGTTGITVSGNVTAGNIIGTIVAGSNPISTTGNISAGFFIGNGSALTGIDATAIQNGTANVRTFLDANVAISAAGTANVLVVTSTGTNITGTLDTTGNANVGNLGTTGNISAAYFLGNGSQLTGIDATAIQNGTANVRTFLDANVAISAAGNANVLLITGDGANIAGTFNVTGNAIVGGDLTVNGNVFSINITDLNVEDPIIGLGRLANNQPLTSNDGKDRGEQLWYYTSSEKSAFIGFDNNADKLTAALDVSISNEIVTVNNYGNFVVGNLEAQNVSITGNIVDSGALTIITGSSGNVALAPNGTNTLVATTTGVVLTGTLTFASGGNVSAGNILNTNSNGVGNIGNSTTYFNTVFAKATSAQYADIAEMYVADAYYEPGTVLSFGGTHEVTGSTVACDARIAGVVSTNPSYLMNSTLSGDHVAAVALMGRVATFVQGPVVKGDMMVSAGNGMAMSCSAPQMGTVIGKALEDFSGSVGKIELVVGRL
jgi:hypothetical protein